MVILFVLYFIIINSWLPQNHSDTGLGQFYSNLQILVNITHISLVYITKTLKSKVAFVNMS